MNISKIEKNINLLRMIRQVLCSFCQVVLYIRNSGRNYSLELCHLLELTWYISVAGISKMLSDGFYSAAYPLHEVKIHVSHNLNP